MTAGEALVSAIEILRSVPAADPQGAACEALADWLKVVLTRLSRVADAGSPDTLRNPPARGAHP